MGESCPGPVWCRFELSSLHRHATCKLPWLFRDTRKVEYNPQLHSWRLLLSLGISDRCQSDSHVSFPSARWSDLVHVRRAFIKLLAPWTLGCGSLNERQSNNPDLRQDWLPLGIRNVSMSLLNYRIFRQTISSRVWEFLWTFGRPNHGSGGCFSPKLISSLGPIFRNEGLL